MRNINITATQPIEYILVLKDKMVESVSLKSTKASTAKTNGKLKPGDKNLTLEPAIRLYEAMKYKTMIRLSKDKKHKYLSFTT